MPILHQILQAMSVLQHKHPEADLRKNYIINVELGLIAALGIMILLFNTPLQPGEEMDMSEDEQEVIDMEDIVQTEREETPPPPPQPQPPEEAPEDEVIEDQHFDLESDFEEAAGTDIPPPPPDDNDVEEEQEIFEVVEDMPEPIGGQQAINEQVEYPETARRAGIEGRVFLEFLVDENGNISEVEIIRSPGGGTEEAAIEAILTVEWRPGRQRGQPVPVRMSWQVNFRLQN